MAIVPRFRVISEHLPIAAATQVIAGQAVSIDTNGYAVLADANGSYTNPVGLAGDQTLSLQAGEWTDRVPDLGNETWASGKMTIYMGGVFWLDIDDGALYRGDGSTTLNGVVENASYAPGDKLYLSNTAGYLNKSNSGAALVATVLVGNTTLDAGIPGEYEPHSANLVVDGTPRTWVQAKLAI